MTRFARAHSSRSSSFAKSLQGVSSLALARGAWRQMTVVSLVGGSLLVAGYAHANSIWTGGNGDHQWGTVGNWDNGVPNSAGTLVTIGDADTTLGSNSITLGGTYKLGQLLVTTANQLGPQVPVTLTGGTLSFDNGAGLAEITLDGFRDLTINSNIIAASALKINNGSAYGMSLTIAGSINAGGNALTLNAAANANLTVGAISGAGSVTKTGGGTLVLNGANTLSNAVNFNFDAGTVKIDNNGAFGQAVIDLSAGNGQVFDISSANRTLSNAVRLNSTGFTVTGGKALAFTASQNNTLTSTFSLGIDPATTLTFGPNFAFQGSGALQKRGNGILILESKNNTFSGGVEVIGGTVQTASFTSANGALLLLGGTPVVSGNQMLGLGNITLSTRTNLNILGATGSSVKIGNQGDGGAFRLTLGTESVVRFNNASVTFAGGTIDFGTGAGPKGQLVFSGAVTLGDTQFVNSDAASMQLGGAVTFLNASGIAGSGIDFIFNSTAAAQGIDSSSSALHFTGNMTVDAGASTVVSFANTPSLTIDKALTVKGGTLNLGAIPVTVPSLILSGGTMVLGAANQFASAPTITLIDSTNSTIKLSSFNQTFGDILGTGAVTFDFGTFGTPTTLTLGAITGSPSILRISGWEGAPNSSIDSVRVSGSPDASILNNTWFQGFAKGADIVGGELRPRSNITSYWDGGANQAIPLWTTGANWDGDDAFNVPNHVGATAIFDDTARDLGNKTVYLQGGTITLGEFLYSDTLSTGTFNINTQDSSILVFNSGTANPAKLTLQSASNYLRFFSQTKLDSTLQVSVTSGRYILLEGVVSGTQGIIKEGAGFLRFSGNNSFAGGIIMNAGRLELNTNTAAGSGALTINAGAVYGGTFANTHSNQLIFSGTNFLLDTYQSTYQGSISLNNTIALQTIDSLSFSSMTDLIGSGKLQLTSTSDTSARYFYSANSTFSGGLQVDRGGVYTTLTNNLTIGTDAGHNYFGSGNITIGLSGATTYLAKIAVTSNGNTGRLASGTLTIENGTRAATVERNSFQFLGGGAFALEGGILDGGSGTVKGNLEVAGDLTFGGTNFSRIPHISINTDSNPNKTSTVYGTPQGVFTFEKKGVGVTTLDGGTIGTGAFAPNSITFTKGALQLGADNQIALSTSIILNGGALGTNGYSANLGQLQLLANSALQLGNFGHLTFASVGTAAASTWNTSAILTLQNGGQTWTADEGAATFVRFTSNPSFSDVQLSNIAFTGYEAGAKTETDGSYWYLIPNALPTNEWSGGGADANWGNNSNWLAGAYPNGLTASATFRDADAAFVTPGRIVVVDGDYSLQRLNLQSSASQIFTIGGTGSLTFAATGAEVTQANANSVTLSAPIILTGPTTLALQALNSSGFLELDGVISGNDGSLIKTGIGTLRLSSGNNTYAAGNTSAGFFWQDPSLIQVNASGAVFGGGLLTIGDDSGKTYLLETRGDHGQTPAGVPTGSGNRTVTNDFVLAGNLTLQLDSNLGTPTDPSTIPNNNTNLTGVKTLTFSGAGTLAGSSKYIINTYRFGSNWTDTIGGVQVNLTFSGKLSGAGGILKTGAGVLTLGNGSNDFTGGVTYQDGRLVLLASGALGTGLLTIQPSSSYNVQMYTPVTYNDLGTGALVFNNRINFVASSFATRFAGVIKFDHNSYDENNNLVSPSTLNGTVQIANGVGAGLVIFGKNHVLANGTSTGALSIGTSVRFEGANIFTGNTGFSAQTLQIGVDTVKDANNAIVSGALGKGVLTWGAGGKLAAYSDQGSGILTRILSNQITLNANAVRFGAFGDAKTLILDTPFITLRNGNDWALTGDTGTTLRIASQLRDGSVASGLTLATGSRGTLELTNGNNQLSAGILVSQGIPISTIALLATATGDVTLGRVQAGQNYFGTGALTLNGGTTRINTIDGASVYLSGSGMTMSDTGSLTVAGGNNIATYFDSNSSFTGTATTGAITTPGTLYKTGDGTVTNVGARLVTPELAITSGTLRLTNANLAAGVGRVTLGGGTLATAGLSQSFGSASLVLTANSTFDFGNGSTLATPAILTFSNLTLDGANNNLGDSNYTLIISNWDGNLSTGASYDQFVILSGVQQGQRINNILFRSSNPNVEYASGAKVIVNANGKYELVPFGSAFVWLNTDGNGSWSAENWSDAGSPGSAGATAVFSDAYANLNGSTISVDNNTIVGAISFRSTQNQAFTFTGGSFTFNSGSTDPADISLTGNSTPTINSAITLASNLSLNGGEAARLALNGAVSGPARSITKNGAFALSLGSSDSNFTGGLTVNDGTVEFAASSQINSGALTSGPAGIGTLTVNGGTLVASGGAQSLGNSVTLAGDFTIAGGNALTFSGSNGAVGTIAADTTIMVDDAAGSLTFGTNLPLTGTGALTKTGLGTLNFNGNSPSYSGAITIALGTVGIGANTGFGTGQVTLADGTSLVANTDGLVVSNAIALDASRQTISTGANALTLTGVISGVGSLDKTGTGVLTLGGDSSYTGGTTISEGTLLLTSATGAGTGEITVDSILNLGFSDAALANNLTGTGTTTVTGSNVLLSGDNNGFTGTLSIANGGSARVETAAALGEATVALAGTLTVEPTSGNFSFDNKLTGAGALIGSMASGADVLSFGTTTGTGFTGTLAMGQGTLAIDDNATTALGNATLSLNAGSVGSVSGTQSIASVVLNGGTLAPVFDPQTGDAASLTMGMLALNSGTLVLDLGALGTPAGILVMDDGKTNNLLTAGTITGALSNISIVDRGGNAVVGTHTQTIRQEKANVIVDVAIGTYDTSVTLVNGASEDIIQSTSVLTELSLIADQTLSLTEPAAATGTAAKLRALVSGTGNLELAAATAITVSNDLNSYTGTTTIASGTTLVGASGVFASSSAMIVATGATLDLNNIATTVQNLQGSGTVNASGALTVNSTQASSFDGLISGASDLTKTGTGTLALTGANNYQGVTAVNAGTLLISNAGAVSSGAVSVASGATFNLGFDNASFANALSGSGTVAVSGNVVTLSGNNAGLTNAALFNITGSALVTTAANLGSADVDLNGAGSRLSVSGAGFSFANTLTGEGTLSVAMTAVTDAFTFTNTVGNGFNGTLSMGLGSFVLAGDNTTALRDATLSVETGAVVTVGTGAQQIGDLVLNGGRMVFDASLPGSNSAAGTVVASSFNTEGTGTIEVNVPTTVPSQPVMGNANLLAQDEAGILLQLVSVGAGQAKGGVGTLTLVDQNGAAIPLETATSFDISSNGTTVATGTYDYRMSQGNASDGLYLAYALSRVDILADQTLILQADAGATTANSDLSAQVTGTGNLEIAAGLGRIVSLTNFNNDYTGTTTVSSGTLQLGSNDALGSVVNGLTSQLIIEGGAAVDLNGKTQTIGSLSGAAGSTLNVNVVNGVTSSLTLLNGGVSSGSLTGAGSLMLVGGTLTVTGANAGLTGSVTINSGAIATLNNVAGLGTNGTTTVNGTLGFDTVVGAMSKSVAGAGTVSLTNAASITLDGTNDAFAGIWNTETGTTLTATNEASLGTSTSRVTGSGAFVVSTTANWTLVNALGVDINTDTFSLEKAGTGTLTIERSNDRAGTTSITGGVLTLANAGSVGTGAVTVGTTAGDAMLGLNLAFATDQAFGNTLSGSGVTRVSGTGIATISGANSGYQGAWSISGEAALLENAVDTTTHLGSGVVDILENGRLTIVTDGDFTVTNALTGTGQLFASNQNNGAFSFSANAGSAFEGQVTLTNSTFNLDGDNTLALTRATLEIGEGNVTTVADGNQTIKSLSFAGGTAVFNDTIPDDIVSQSTITTTGVLDLRGGGTVMVREPSFTNNDGPGPNTDLPLLEQDNGNILSQLVIAQGKVEGGAGELVLKDDNGDVISNAELIDINQNNVRVAVGTYDYRLTSGPNNDGLYVNYGLTQLNLLGTGANAVVLTPAANATGASRETSAKIIGSGDLEIAAGAGQLVSLTNSTNSYSGVTKVTSGTLLMGNDHVLGLTSDVQVSSNTGFDTNGYSQTIGAVHVAANGRVNIGSGSTLTISDRQRALGETDGGSFEANTLFGAGTLVVDPSIEHFNGTQLGFTGLLQITGGSQVIVNAANAFDNASGVELVGASDTLSFADQSSYNAAWTAIASGTAAAPIKGAGIVEVLDGSDVTFSGDNSAFSGRFVAAVSSVIRASEQQNLGKASVEVAGRLDLRADGLWALDNIVTGSGVVQKTGAGLLSVGQSLSGFTGLTDVQSGVLVVGEGSVSGLIAGTVRVGSGAVLSGTGRVAGEVYNAGTIAGFNALPSLTSYGENKTSNLTVGPLTNAGIVMLAGSQIGNSLTVTGGLTGVSGSRVILRTVLGDDRSVTDHLILDGGATTGRTGLVIFNGGGVGLQTSVGIEVVQAVNGATTAADSFRLDQQSDGYRSTTGTLAVGAYEYQLVRGGNGGNVNSFYLTSAQPNPEANSNSRLLRPEAGIYGMNAQVSRTMFVSTLHDREGAIQANGDLGYAGWGRISGGRITGRWGANTLSASAGTVKTEVGLDLFKFESTTYGSFYAGIMGGWGHSETESRSRQIEKIGKANGTVEGYSVGAYGTWYQKDKGLGGAYVDSSIQYNWFDNEVRGPGLPLEKYKAHSLNASLEVGYSFMLLSSEKSKLYLEPQAQIIYVNYQADTHIDAGGTKVRQRDGSGVLARIGTRLYGELTLSGGQVIRPYLEGNYWYNQKSGSLYMNNDLVAGGAPRSLGEIKAGISGQMTKNLQVWTDVGMQFGAHHYSAFTAQAGLRYSW